VAFVWLPRLAIERLRRTGGAPPDEHPFALVEAGRVRRLAALNRAARREGLRPGLPLADALAVLPGLAVAPADPAADRAALDTLAEGCGHFTPWVAAETGPHGPGLWLDLSGCAHLFGGEAALLARLVARLRRAGFSARPALADTPGAAWAWARFGRAADPCLPPGGQRAALAPLPVAALRLSVETVAALAAVGLRRVGDLHPLPRAALAARFGAEVGRRLDQVAGAVGEPISPRRPPVEHRVGMAFAEPITRPEDVARAVGHLLGRLCARLAAEGLGLRRLEVGGARVDSTTRAISVGTGRPSHDPAHLGRLLACDLPRLDPGFGIEGLWLAAPEVAPQPPEQTRFGARGAEADPQALDRLIDSLGNRLGFDRLARLVPRQSHLPERAVRPLPPAAPAPPLVWPARRRPVRLFASPEPIEVVAPLPDAPPLLFRWRAVTHRVVRADGAERIGAEWWRATAPDRDYYLVEDETGARFWLYRDGPYGGEPPPGWYLHGLFG